MKYAIVAAAALGTLFAAAPAHAENYDYPGACLVVENGTDHSVDFTVQDPYVNGSWTYEPGNLSAPTIDGNAIKSDSGSFTINVAGDVSWHYNPHMNESWGCNGSWIATIN